MVWIIAITLTAVVLLALLILKTKRRDGGRIRGLFDFGHHKRNELSRRGLFDKSKWR
jgi:hypothetical protein